MTTSPKTPATRTVRHCTWTSPAGRTYSLYRRGRMWLVHWSDPDDADWAEGCGKTVAEAFRNAWCRVIPAGFPYRGSGCARRRASRAAARG